MAKEHPQPAKAWALFDKSRQLVSRHIGLFAVLYIVPLLGNIGSSVDRWPGRDQHHGASLVNWNITGTPALSWQGWTGIGALIALLIIISVVVQMMILAASFQTAKGETPGFSKAWQLVKKFGWRLLGVYIINRAGGSWRVDLADHTWSDFLATLLFGALRAARPRRWRPGGHEARLGSHQAFLRQRMASYRFKLFDCCAQCHTSDRPDHQRYLSDVLHDRPGPPLPRTQKAKLVANISGVV